MPIAITDLPLVRSSNNDLGGAITSPAEEIASNVLNNLFDSITGTEANNGDTEYRCVYFKNTHSGLTLGNAVVTLSEQLAVAGVTISVGLGTSAVGGIEQTIPDESTAPIGVTFTSNVGNPLDVGDLPSGKHIAVWLKRVVEAGSSAFDSEGYSIDISGSSPL